MNYNVFPAISNSLSDLFGSCLTGLITERNSHEKKKDKV